MSYLATTAPRGERGTDYGYCNARVRGMRSRLLGEAFIEQLLDSADVREIIQVLAETEYGPDLETTLLQGLTFAAVDEALKNNLVRTLQKVLGFLDGEAERLVSTFLGRWDIFNVKTVVRGKHMHLAPEEIVESVIPVGKLTAVDIDVLASAEDMRAVVDTLSTWGLPYGVPLRLAMPEYVKTAELSVLELALDRYYSQWGAEQLRGRGPNPKTARKALGIQIDATNILTVMRLLKADLEDAEATEFFLPGGMAVTERLFEEMAALSDIDEVIDRLKPTPYGKPLDDAAILYLETNSMATIERVLEDYVTRRVLASSHGDPLGVGVLISYLWEKENEVTNLRIIVKGKSVGMPRERMRRELILV